MARSGRLVYEVNHRQYIFSKPYYFSTESGSEDIADRRYSSEYGTADVADRRYSSRGEGGGGRRVRKVKRRRYNDIDETR